MKAAKAGSPAIAEGRGFLAVGSVGLAIEAFRKALREQPDSIEALAGLAECYDQMGRYDISRAKYEAALAIAPNNTTLLRTFAASLERQGRHAEATSLRKEAADTERAEAAAMAQMTAPTAPVLLPAVSQPVRRTIAAVPAKPPAAPIKLAEATPRTAPAPVRISPVESQPTPAPVRVSETVSVAPVTVPDARVRLASSSVVSKTEWTIEAPAMAALAASVTVKLPPARTEAAATTVAARAEPAKAAVEQPRVAEAAKPVVATPLVEQAKVLVAASRVEPSQAPPASVRPAKASAPALPRVEIPKLAVAAGPSVTVKLPAARPVAVSPSQKPAAPDPRIIVEATAEKAGPRLERVSLAEVALVTDPRPRWRTEPVRQAAVGSTPRFVSLAELQRNSGLRLLNATRRDGLAARTRLMLNRQGWNGVTIGDYARAREKSLILYSAVTEKAARRLAAKYGIWIARDARPGPLTILLGRDWVTRQLRT